MERVLHTEFTGGVVEYDLVRGIDRLTDAVYVHSISSYVRGTIAPGLLPLDRYVLQVACPGRDSSGMDDNGYDMLWVNIASLGESKPEPQILGLLA